MQALGTHSTVLICNAGDHLSFRISRQIRPSLSMFGWLDRSAQETRFREPRSYECDSLDASEEADLWWVHGVFIRQEELEFEDAAWGKSA